MSNSTFSTSRWLFELTKTILKGAPVFTLASVITTLISQVSMMLAFLMPLKVVMLLGSEGIPRFFPQALLDYDRDILIISLVALSITFYFVNIIFGNLSKQTAKYGAKRLIANTQKIIIFENQEDLASNAYTKYTEALAGLIFALVTTGLFSIFYPDVATLTVIFLVVAYLATYVLYKFSSKLEATIHRKPNTVTNIISNIGFLLIFLYIVVDFLYLSPPDFIVALATIIISRLMLSRLSITTAYLFSLKKDEGKINALFFHHHAFLPEDTKAHQSAWELLKGEQLDSWIKPLVEEAIDQEPDELIIQWKQTQIKNVVLLQVEVCHRTLLIKIFEKKVSSLAQHESTLLVNVDNKHLPCPPFLLATTVDGYHCHVFDISGYEFLSKYNTKQFEQTINKQLLNVTPPEDLIGRYRRSKVLLWERIDKNMLERLTLVATRQEKQLLADFEKALPEIKSTLQALPLSFANNKLNSTSLLQNAENQLTSFDWHFWCIEPTCAGLPLEIGSRTEIHEVIHAATDSRSSLNHFSNDHFEFVTLLSAFEKNFQQQQYAITLSLINPILIKLRQLEKQTGQPTNIEKS